MSKKREGEHRIYMRKRKAFLAAHPYCQIFLHRIGKTEKDVDESGRVHLLKTKPGLEVEYFMPVPRSVEIHHGKKPKKKYYLDESTWWAASREEHRWVEDNKAQARALGLLA